MAKDGYHHGDLRSALLEAAGAAVAEQGPDGVSLRELAKTLGVSPAAPYRHFPDRQALLNEVAVQGFTQLGQDYAAAAQNVDPASALRATGRAYLDLAFKRPGLFQLMFESDLLGSSSPPELLHQAAAAWQALHDAVARANPGADLAEVKLRTITGWSVLQGFVTIQRGGRLKAFMTEPLTERELIDAVLDKAQA